MRSAIPSQSSLSAPRLQEFVPGVAVAVDQARHDDLAMGIDQFAWLKARTQLGRRADGGDAVADDGDRAVIDDPPRRVHRDDRAANDQDIRRLGCGRKRRVEYKERGQGRQRADPSAQ